MKKVTSRTTINRDVIRKLSALQTKALEMTGESLHTDVVQSQVMPRDQGTLQNESTFVDTSEAKQGHVALVSSTPYARRLYFHPEYNFQTKENPNAKGKWLADYEKGGLKQDFAQKAFNGHCRRLGG